MHKRLKIATAIAKANWHNTPTLVREALSEGSLDSDMVACKNDHGETLLHVLVTKFAYLHHHWFSGISEKSFDDCLEPDAVAQLKLTGNYRYLWHELVRDCIKASAPLHAVDELQRTPFCTILDTIGKYYCVQWNYTVDKAYGFFKDILHSWLADLLASGIDLQRYGAEEKALGRWNQYHHYSHTFGFELVAFSYGARLEDWHFAISQPSDEFSGNFWAMIEGCSGEQQPSQELFDLAMPGLWPEEAED